MGALDDLKNGSYPVFNTLAGRNQEHDLFMEQIAPIEAESLDEISPDAGTVGAAEFLNFTLNDEGVHMTTPEDIDINFWASLGLPSNINTAVLCMATIGDYIYVGGNFSKFGGISAENIIAYNKLTGTWSTLSTGLNGNCNGMAVIGTDLYITGAFTLAGGVANTAYLAKWNGSAFSALSTGLNGTGRALAVIGTDLYIGGAFTLAGGVSNTVHLAKWNGSAFSALSTGATGADSVYALAVIGTDLYVGGNDTTYGGVAANYLATWNGSAFSALGTGLNSGCKSLAVIGTDLYIGGVFTLAGGVAGTAYIARWDGSSFYPLNSGLNNWCYSLSVIDTNLYVGGIFTLADNIENTSYIAMWDGSIFSPLGSGLNNFCYSILAVGTDLYVGGTFTTAGSRPSVGIAAYLRTLQSVLAYLEVSTQALQDNGGVFPNNLTVLGAVNASNVNNSGWIEISDAWAYASASTFTVPSDATVTYQKGDFLRWKQGGAYKYGVVVGLTSTVVTILVNTNYTIANSAITNIAMSRQRNPLGWPGWFDISQTGVVSGSGGSAGTYAQTVFGSRVRITGNSILHVGILKITNVGSWAGNLQLAAPITPTDLGVSVGGGIWANAALAAKGYMYPISGQYLFYKTFPTANIQWTDVAVNDWLQWRIEYQF